MVVIRLTEPNDWGRPPKSPMGMNKTFEEVQSGIRSLYKENGSGVINEIMIGKVIEISVVGSKKNMKFL